MKRLNKLLIIIFMIGVFLLAGCDKFSFNTFNASEEQTDNDSSTKSEDSQSKTDKVKTEPKTDSKENSFTENGSEKNNTKEISLNSGETQTDDVTPTATVIVPTANMDLAVYTVNADTSNIEPVTALIPKNSEITPELIVTTVIESMADQSIIIGVKNVTTKKDAIIVNFEKDKTPDMNMGSGYEAAILDAIAQSLIDNLNNYKKVIYRIDDKAYVSGVFEKGIDEPYFGDN